GAEERGEAQLLAALGHGEDVVVGGALLGFGEDAKVHGLSVPGQAQQAVPGRGSTRGLRPLSCAVGTSHGSRGCLVIASCGGGSCVSRRCQRAITSGVHESIIVVGPPPFLCPITVGGRRGCCHGNFLAASAAS